MSEKGVYLPRGVSPSLSREGITIVNHFMVFVPSSYANVFSFFCTRKHDSSKRATLPIFEQQIEMARSGVMVRELLGLEHLAPDVKSSTQIWVSHTQKRKDDDGGPFPFNVRDAAITGSGLPKKGPICASVEVTEAVNDDVIGKVRRSGVLPQIGRTDDGLIIPSDSRNTTNTGAKNSGTANSKLATAAIAGSVLVGEETAAAKFSVLQIYRADDGAFLPAGQGNDGDGVAGANDAFKAVSGCFSLDLQGFEVPISDLFRSEGHVSPKTWRGLSGLFVCGYSSPDPIVEQTTRRAGGHKSALSDAKPGLFAACYGSRGPDPVNGEGKDDVVGLSVFRSASAMSDSGGFLNEWRQDSPSLFVEGRLLLLRRWQRRNFGCARSHQRRPELFLLPLSVVSGDVSPVFPNGFGICCACSCEIRSRWVILTGFGVHQFMGTGYRYSFNIDAKADDGVYETALYSRSRWSMGLMEVVC